MLAVRTMKRSVKIFLAWRHKDKLESEDDSDAGRQDNEEVKHFLHGVIRTSRIAGTARMLAVRTKKRPVKICLAWRHKDELDSGDDSDACR